MSQTARRWWIYGSLGLAAGGIAAAFAATSSHQSRPGLTVLLTLLVGWSFIASGLIAWSVRPSNRIGRLLAAVGFTWFINPLQFANGSVPFTIGQALGAVVLGFFIHLVLAYPSGCLLHRRERVLVAAGYLAALVLPTLTLLFDRHPETDCNNCPDNLLLVHPSHRLAELTTAFADLTGLILITAAFVILVRRWQAASVAARRTLQPIVFSGGLAVFLLALSFGVSLVSHHAANTVIGPLSLLAVATVPYFILIGLLRNRLARSGILRLIVDTPDELTLGEAEFHLREAVGDPTLRLAYWVDDLTGYVNVRGKPFVIPEDTPTRVTTYVDYEGAALAALYHDGALLENPDLLEELAGVVRMGLVKDRGQRALRATEIRNRALLDAIPDLMFRISSEGRYLDYRAPEEGELVDPLVVGKTVWQRLPADLADMLMAAGARAIADREVQTLEYELQFDDGPRFFEGRIAASGEDEFLLIIRNITDRKRQEQELQASRARIVAAGDEERRRLERNLHDGAQQRLVSLSLALRVAQTQLRQSPEAAEEMLTSARDELAQALEELRELARGIHPAILTDRGLGAALETLAARAPLPVEIERDETSLPAPVEAAAYYVVSEALANIAKYADASSVRVRVAQENGTALVEVTDDGIGGADPARGSGLRGLADRVAALDGRLEVESPRGRGTTIRADIPLRLG